jgi:hypothetical protein
LTIAAVILFTKPKRLVDFRNAAAPVLCLIFYVPAAIALADVHLDRSTPQSHRIEVIGHSDHDGSKPSYRLELAPWSKQSHDWSASVGKALYEKGITSGQICLFHHHGALGIDWFTLGPIEDCSN